MTTALTQVPYYFAIDCDHDISGDVLNLSLDRTYGVTATYVPSPPTTIVADALAATPVPTGFIRYWWSATAGPGQQLALVYASQLVHGKLTDTPNVLYVAWQVVVPTD